MTWYPSGSEPPPSRPRPTPDERDEDTAVVHEDDPTVSSPRRKTELRGSALSDEDQPTIARPKLSVDEDTNTFDDDDPTITRKALPRKEPAADILDSRYQLLAQIGAGGMGEVWRARHIKLARDVAIKFLTNEEGGSRFEQEAQAIAAIRHTGVVDVLDFGETRRGVPYFVMELLEGETLSSRVRRTGPLSWALVRNIALEISDALCHAHEIGVIHRDLKPSNVVVLDKPPPRGSSTKLIDFGIAKLLDAGRPSLTKSGYIQGTPAYMAPEQVLGEDVDARTDVYGLGCLLYFLLSGRRLFADKKGAVALQAQLEQTPPRMTELVPGLPIPPDVEAVVFRALAKDKTARFQSMRDLHDALFSIPPDASASMSAKAKLRPAVKGPFDQLAAKQSDTGLRTTASYSSSELTDERGTKLDSSSSGSSSSAASSSTNAPSTTRDRVLIALAIVGSLTLIVAAVLGLIWAAQ